MNRPYQVERECTHGGQIRRSLETFQHLLPETPVFVETGCGISTLSLAEAGRKYNAVIYSCDYNQKKIDALKKRAGERVDNVTFVTGDSIESLGELSGNHPHIHFLFLDAAASAMHTFREFQAAETSLGPGSLLLIDNAALPGETRLLSPCRKGKVIVPYLQASECWEVFGHPLSGDSMISAVHHAKPGYADPSFEWPNYVDPWEWSLENEWE